MRGTSASAGEALRAATREAVRDERVRRGAQRRGGAREATARRARAAIGARRDAALGAWAALDVDPDALAARSAGPSARSRSSPRPRRAPPPAGWSRSRPTARRSTTRSTPGATRSTPSSPSSTATSLTDDLEGDFDDAAALIDRLTRTRGDIETWIAHAAAVDKLQDLEAAVGFCIERRVPAQQLVDVLERSALEAIADRLLEATATNSARCAPPSATGSSRSTPSSTSGSSATPRTA